MRQDGFTVVVPATTANLGPGFDSIGLALALYMKVTITVSETWRVIYDDSEFNSLPNGADNLIVVTIQQVASRVGRQVCALQLYVKSDIPLGKGLGSSAAAVACGIEIANHILQLELSSKEKITIGSEMEGHIDNIAAAIVGGATISYYGNKEIEVIHLPKPSVGIVILLPPQLLPTDVSRALLPDKLSHTASVQGSAASNVLSAAIVLNDWETVGRMMEKDILHEEYRKHLFPNFEDIRKECKVLGGLGMTISGAGPSLCLIVKGGTEKKFAKQLALKFPYYEGIAVQPSMSGTIISNIKKTASSLPFELSE